MAWSRAVVSFVSFPLLMAVSDCGGGGALPQPKAPTYEHAEETSCQVVKSHAEPLVVEWPLTERAKLESATRGGPVAVQYQGCTMKLLPRCKVPGKYDYKPVTRKRDDLAIKNKQELYANLPAGAAQLKGEIENGGELGVRMTIVGRWEYDGSALQKSQLDGECEGATHTIAAVTVGAFEFSSYAQSQVGGGVSIAGAGAGGNASAAKRVLAADGESTACEASKHSDTGPPEGCGAMIRVEVLALETDPSKAKFASLDGKLRKTSEEIQSLWDLKGEVGNELAQASCLQGGGRERINQEIARESESLDRYKQMLSELRGRMPSGPQDETGMVRARDMESIANELIQEIRRSHTRLAALSDSLRGMIAGACPVRLDLSFQNGMGSELVETRREIRFDGTPQFTMATDDGHMPPQTAVYSGTVAPGDHRVAALLHYAIKGRPGTTLEVRAIKVLNVPQNGIMPQVIRPTLKPGASLEKRVSVVLDDGERKTPMDVEAEVVDAKTAPMK